MSEFRICDIDRARIHEVKFQMTFIFYYDPVNQRTRQIRRDICEPCMKKLFKGKPYKELHTQTRHVNIYKTTPPWRKKKKRPEKILGEVNA